MLKQVNKRAFKLSSLVRICLNSKIYDIIFKIEKRGFGMSKRQTLYYKQFLISTGIVGIVIFILMLYFFISLRQNYFESRTSEAEKVCVEVSNIIQENKNTADYLYRDLYRSRQELEDLIAYFTLEPEEYWEFRLDLYSKSNLNKYRSMETFLDSAFEASESLKKIELISYYKMDNTVVYKNEIFHYMNGKDRLTEIENHTEKTSDIIFIKEVRHPDTFKLEGCIILTFENSNQFENLINSKSYAELIVTKDFIQPIYNENALERWYNVIQSSKTGEQENIFSYTILNKNIDAYQIFVFLNHVSASEIPMSSIIMIIFIGIIVFTLSVLGISVHIKKLIRRVNIILRGMNEVKKGNLTINIPVPESGDELDMISADFNDMCKRLNEHIRKQYLAEIDKKNAEIHAMQSQINPHFLYNTLEAIRMKAICNGDKEVGKMLYNMSILFRRQLKDNDFITIADELDYCKQYFELFTMRYPNIFKYEIICPESLMNKKIIKFILQPIIENYFIHGIRSTKQDNIIKVYVNQNKNSIDFHIIDNGRGMSEDVIKNKNEELQNTLNIEHNNKSIGVSNVNRRIKAIYGEKYGVKLRENNEKMGLEVIVKIKEEV